ncbi:MAG: SDR family NAD(P)-dependent oxidoreductase [Candidatus Hydrogenedens sp.]|nr:SDR family NAD(P)-dependent oxidoreductase [Candidatus Hydrogenedens sp.]
MSTFKNKRILITGAGMGMGRLMTLRAVEEGAGAIAMWDINAEAMEKTAAEARAKGGTIHTFVADVSNLDSIKAAAAQTLETMGGVDILFNNAGIVRGGSFVDHTHDDLELTIRINVLGVMQVTKCILPSMIAQGSGHIVNLASAAGLMPVPLQSAYSPSKWAVLSFSEALRVEQETDKTGVRVTAICPSYIDTGMFAGVEAPLLTPILQPQDAVNRIFNAVKGDKLVVCMPIIVNLLPVFRALMPIRMFDLIVGRLFRVHTSMKAFTGRH